MKVASSSFFIRAAPAKGAGVAIQAKGLCFKIKGKDTSPSLDFLHDLLPNPILPLSQGASVNHIGKVKINTKFLSVALGHQEEILQYSQR
jgi:hypothetical protein